MSEETKENKIINSTDRLEKIESLSKIFSFLFIPIFIAVGGWKMQSDLATRSVDKDYVSLAVSILNTEANENNVPLRQWAVDVLSNKSPVEISESLADKLVSGDVVLPMTQNSTRGWFVDKVMRECGLGFEAALRLATPGRTGNVIKLKTCSGSSVTLSPSCKLSCEDASSKIGG